MDTAREAMLDELLQLHRAGKLTPELYQGFRGDAGPADAARAAEMAGRVGDRAMENRLAKMARGEKVREV